MDINFFHEYINYLFKDGYIEADKFKNTKVPDTLYKFFPCDKNRIDSLTNQNLWLAQHETFNDPNEFEFMFIDENKFANAKPIGKQWDIYCHFLGKNFFNIKFNDAKKIMDAQKKLVSISCFTTDPYNDYFWSEYANKKNGFCVEYKLNDKCNFYPIVYTDEKIEISEILKTFISEVKMVNFQEAEYKKNGKNYNIISEEGMKYVSFLYFNFCSKKTKWEMENEYRIIYSNDNIQTTKGKLVSYNDLYITANKIFISDQCSDQDKKSLEKIAQKLHVDYFHI